MFPQGPPAEEINLFYVRIGALEERDVGAQPRRRLRVRHEVDDRLVLHRVELRDVAIEGGGGEDGGRGAAEGRAQNGERREEAEASFHSRTRLFR